MCPWNTDAPVSRLMDGQTVRWMNSLMKEDQIIFLTMIILFMDFNHDLIKMNKQMDKLKDGQIHESKFDVRIISNKLWPGEV